jgi:hypothetical protein
MPISIHIGRGPVGNFKIEAFTQMINSTDKSREALIALGQTFAKSYASKNGGLLEGFLAVVPEVAAAAYEANQKYEARLKQEVASRAKLDSPRSPASLSRVGSSPALERVRITLSQLHQRDSNSPVQSSGASAISAAKPPKAPAVPCAFKPVPTLEITE